MSSPPHTSPTYSVSSGSLNNKDLCARWENIHDRSEQRSPFSTLQFAAGLNTCLGYKSTIFLLSKSSEDICGILIYWLKKGPFKIGVVPPFTSFSSLILPAAKQFSTSPEALEPYLLLLKRVKEAFSSLQFHHHPSLRDIRIFNWSRWSTSPLYTYHIDLQSNYGIQKNWSTSMKRNLKNQVANYIFEERPDQLPRVLELVQDSYARHNRPLPTPLPGLLSFARHLQNTGMVRVFTLTPRNEMRPTAGLALLHDSEVAYYWLAGSIPGPSMTVLLGNLLPQLQEEGFRTFDFVGANTPPIAEFKRRFGPTLVPYYSSSITHNRLLESLRFAKRMIG